ncbi:hypothetical protein AVEN_101149-1 [Araneus ventricosus]|uniref:Uncharacterized protein n=1 Tax=Araneus ventricosus TaxID=182803 RepID=A0A4Y2DEG0_ARAVE|nr:hypothetical protein AVEN_101149-1 [Araneus ventricosus]
MYDVNSPTRRIMENEGPLTTAQENNRSRTDQQRKQTTAHRQQLTGNNSSILLDPSTQTVSKPLTTTIAAPSTALSPPTPQPAQQTKLQSRSFDQHTTTLECKRGPFILCPTGCDITWKYLTHSSISSSNGNIEKMIAYSGIFDLSPR